MKFRVEVLLKANLRLRPIWLLSRYPLLIKTLKPFSQKQILTQIVTQPGDHDADDVLVVHPLRVEALQLLGERPGQVGDADGVLEAGVGGVGVHQVTRAGLLKERLE